MSEPRHALPAMRPRCCFRYFTFFGIIMAVYLLTAFRPGLPARAASSLGRPRRRPFLRLGVVRVGLRASRRAAAVPSTAAESAPTGAPPGGATPKAAPASPDRLLEPALPAGVLPALAGARAAPAARAAARVRATSPDVWSDLESHPCRARP